MSDYVQAWQVLAVQPIKPYTSPQWFVEPIDDWDYAPHGENGGPGGIEDANTIEVLDRNIHGWNANAIIRASVDDGTSTYSYDYLARLTEGA